MCTRYVFTDPAEAIRDLFRITAPLPNWPPSYNVAPTNTMPVIRPVEGGREIALMEWGLVPFFSKDGARSFTTFNARCEEVRTKPMYREPFRYRRCIVPASGHLEFLVADNPLRRHVLYRIGRESWRARWDGGLNEKH